MTSRNILYTVILLPLMFASLTSRAQEDVKITAIPVTTNIFMLSGDGGNIGLFTGEDGTFLIDDQFAPLTQKILAAIKAVGGDEPRFLINTHFHGDHTGGNENFGNMGSLIVSHENVRKRLVDGSYIAAFGMNAPPAKKVALPVVTYAENMHFHINGDSVSAIHVPSAHTDGDSIIHFENANVVHAGDVFFNGFYPFIDAANGGSLKGTIDAVDAILAVTDSKSKIIPGHGPLADRAQLGAYRDMLATTYKRLLKLKNQGVSAEEAISQKPLADLETDWGKGIFTGEKWIGVIYPGVF